MAVNNFLPRGLAAPISLCCKTRAFEKLVSHTLKGRNHDNNRSSPRFFQDDRGDISNAIDCGKRRAAKFQDRSEERRVGKECRSRWSTDQERKKNSKHG